MVNKEIPESDKRFYGGVIVALDVVAAAGEEVLCREICEATGKNNDFLSEIEENALPETKKVLRQEGVLKKNM